MPAFAPASAQTAIRVNLSGIFVSLELSRSSWLITSLSPGGGDKMSKHLVRSGDAMGLLGQLAELQAKAQARTGQTFPIIVIQEAGLDGFWVHRVLEREGIESHVADAASILISRRRRRAKTDRIDGEALLRTLLAYKRGEPRVCAMVRAPSPQEEDERRLCRERKTLVAERVAHVNRIKGLLFAQGISDYEPLHRDRRQRLEELTTGDGRPLPAHLKAQIGRELDRLELLLRQLKAVEAAAGGRLCGAGADAMAERIGGTRTGRVQIGQSEAADHLDPARMALAAAPADVRAEPLVQGSRQVQRRPREADDDRRPCPKAARRAVEVRQQRRRHRGRGDEGCLSGAGHRILNRLDPDRVLTDPGGRTERRHGCGSRYPRLVSPS